MTAVAQGFETATAAPTTNTNFKPASDIVLIEATIGSAEMLEVLNIMLTEFISMLPGRPDVITTPIGGGFDAIMARPGILVCAENRVTFNIQARPAQGAIHVEMRMSNGMTFFQYSPSFMSRLCDTACDALKLRFVGGGGAYVPTSPDFKRSLKRAVIQRQS